MTPYFALQWFHPKSLFGIRGSVGSSQYLVVGIVLMIVKYSVEFLTILSTTNKWYSPFDFVSPLLSGREKYLIEGPAWLGAAWLIWTLPFLAICILMSVRRCADAGVSLWFAFVMLIPIFNLIVMVIFAILPTKQEELAVENPFQATIEPDRLKITKTPADAWQAAFVGLISGVLYLILTVVFTVYLLGSYGAALFFGTPIVATAFSSFWLNRTVRRSLGFTIGHSLLVIMLASSAFLLLGLEGGICILMAIPLFAPLAILGALVGYTIARGATLESDQKRGMIGCLIGLPIIAAIETRVQENPILEVRSEIVIQAPIDRVWDQVIDFPNIDAKPKGILRWGVAYPIRASIDGRGVGATRHCEFTTGTFVEPITGWDKPFRLSFDVTSQPDPMVELSPYHSIHPPHLDKSFESVRGEFELQKLSDETTRLIGTTWYRVDLGPRVYWKLWTDSIVHAIHDRVLEHIRSECMKRAQKTSL